MPGERVIAMKKSKKTRILVILIIVSALLIYPLYSLFHVGDFSAEDYQGYLSGELQDMTSDRIENKFDAMSAAQKLWYEVYHIPAGSRHMQVSYDEHNDCWLVSGLIWEAYFCQYSSCAGCSGGASYAIISTDGEVLAVWRDY